MTASDVADHIDHIRAVAGIDAIGVGGDYDGVPTMGEELADVSSYPLVFEELRSAATPMRSCERSPARTSSE